MRAFRCPLFALLLPALAGATSAERASVKITRLASNPIVHAGLDERMGTNINGPSLIRVPDWVESRLSRYYLYFAHHKGRYIRLAFA